jgi:xanthine dehydrogenase small subunit
MEKKTRFILNYDEVSTDVPSGMVTLDFLRRNHGLTATREGCREGDCGACMVLLGELRNGGVLYRAVNSCLLPVGDLRGRHLVTVEGLNGPALLPIQQAIVDEGATQCGFCTPGFVVSLAGFLLSSPRWDQDAAMDAVAGNLCRCTGYLSVRRAVARLCATLGTAGPPSSQAERLSLLVDRRLVPPNLKMISRRLAALAEPPSPGPAEGGTVAWVAGGTDLFAQRPEELQECALHFLSQDDELRGIRVEQGRCAIGAATPLSDIEDSTELQACLPDLQRCLRLVASRSIRHRATISGNIVNASPIGDLTILLLALDAKLTLSDGRHKRTLHLSEFFAGYKKINKRPGELLLDVHFALPRPGTVFHFEKVSRRAHLDIASVNSAMLAECEAGVISVLHLSAGGVAPIPLYLARTAQTLLGKPLTASAARSALASAREEIAPISDVRGSADYKRRLLERLLIAHLLRLDPRLEEELAL